MSLDTSTLRITPERLSSLRRVATTESIGSSTRIEGAKLSDRDIERLLANLQIGTFATRDEEEVAGYAEVMDTIFNADAIPLTENHIRQLHRDLLVHSPKDERHRGTYKTLTNNVEAFDENGRSLGVVLATATPFDPGPGLESRARPQALGGGWLLRDDRRGDDLWAKSRVRAA